MKSHIMMYFIFLNVELPRLFNTNGLLPEYVYSIGKHGG